MKTYAVIMAGGSGTRLWPLSCEERPKQFLKLNGKETLLNETIYRLLPLIPMECILVVTARKYEALMKETLPEGFCPENILYEPCARNTAACVGYAAAEIIRRDHDGMMCIFPADHAVADPESFRETVRKGLDFLKTEQVLMTIGIRPSYAASGYGYLQMENGRKTSAGGWKMEAGEICRVRRFVEKPDQEMAQGYVKSGDYAWNSGMFLWRAVTIMEHFAQLLPRVENYLRELICAESREFQTKLEEIYPRLPSLSIDYGIMEQAEDIWTICGDFGWDDVGSFASLEHLQGADSEGNTIIGKGRGIDIRDCTFYSQQRLITAIGVEHLTIIDSGDAVLVCPKSRVQDVKLLVDEMRKEQS